MKLWWQKLIIYGVITALICTAVVLSVNFATKNLGKTVIASEPIVVIVVKEEKIPEEPATKEEAKIEDVEVETTIEEKASTETIAEGEIPAFYESEGGIPYNGTEWNVDVAPDEIEVFTCGPAEINGVVLKGGSNPDRGGVIVLLPDPKNEKVINYTIKKVIAGSNWHGAIDFGRVPTEKDWKMLVDDRVKAMMEAPNGTSGKGCQIVDVVVIQGDNVIYQKTFEK